MQFVPLSYHYGNLDSMDSRLDPIHKTDSQHWARGIKSVVGELPALEMGFFIRFVWRCTLANIFLRNNQVYEYM